MLGDSKDNSEQILKDKGVVVVNSNIITEEGYGPARNHLREMATKFFPHATWNVYFDADERILGKDIHHRDRLLGVSRLPIKNDKVG